MRRVLHLVAVVGLLVGAAACDEDMVNRNVDPTPGSESGAGGLGAGGEGAGGEGVGGEGTGGQDTGDAAGTNGPLLLIMDSSGSMNEPGPDGQPLLDGAKQALHELVAALPDDQEVGLRVYGHRYNTHARACQDTELVHPVSPLDRPALTSTIDGFEAVGGTPIGLSLQEGAEDLPQSGPRTIILVSDGLDTCAPPDPCEVAFDLTADTNEFVIHTIGFALGDGDDADRARDELACIAAAGGGDFEDASNAAELADSLQRSASK